jgi:hypothetical protein
MTTVIGGSSPSITFSDSTTQSTAALPLTGGSLTGNITSTGSISSVNTFGFKNRIINGGMVIDQRNSGTAQNNLAAGWVYTVDRWEVYSNNSSRFNSQQNKGAVTPPTGFKNYLGVSVNTGYSVGASDYNILAQPIEGFNTSDLGFGASGASTVTLSFWVYTSVTGTHSGFLANSSLVTAYPFTFTVSSANTWTQVSVTITGSTSGTWVGATNGIGVYVGFNLGNGSNYQGTANAWNSSAYIQPTGSVSVVATSSATFYITGVQLEVGSVATSFDYRPYGTELALCQRYFIQLAGQTNNYASLAFGSMYSTTMGSYVMYLPVPMRTLPSSTQPSTTGTIFIQNAGINISSWGGPYSTAGSIIEGDFTLASAWTSGNVGLIRFNNSSGTKNFTFSAEL